MLRRSLWWFLAIGCVGLCVTLGKSFVQSTPSLAAPSTQSAIATPAFLVSRALAVQGTPAAVVAADLNNDGKADLVIANAQAGTVEVFLGKGGGRFSSPVSYSVSGKPVALSVVDFRGDGKLGIAVANNDNDTVSVLFGNGDGTLQAATSYAVPKGPVFLTAADLQGTGHPDLLIAGAGSNAVAVLRNNGDGTYHFYGQYSISAAPRAIATGDFRGIGRTDVASANADGSVTILLNDGHSGLQYGSTYKTGTSLSAVAVADFNHDGHLDLAVADASANSVRLLRGNGDGTFTAAATLRVGNEPASLAIADLNHDGNLDLISANRSANTVSVLLGKGDGTFKTAPDFVVGNSPTSVAVVDFDGAGRLSLATANYLDGTVSIPLGHGDGSFEAAQNYRTNLDRQSVAVGDLDGDGLRDLLVTNFCGTDTSCTSNGSASVFLNNGNGSFRRGATFALGKGPIAVALADVNGDGKLDVITANQDENTASVMLGNGDGTFRQAMSYSVGYSPIAVAVANLHNDGKPDLVVLNRCSSSSCDSAGSVSILRGNGDGSFGGVTTYAAGFNPSGLAIGDLRGSGNRDIVVANSCGRNSACSSGSATILLNDGAGNFQAAPDVALGKMPSAVAVGDLREIGTLDLVASYKGSNQVGVLLGHGDGTFAAQSVYAVGSAPSSVAVGKFTGGANLDVAVANLNSATVSLLAGNGDGTLQAAVHYPVGSAPGVIVAADLSGGGHADLISASGSSASPSASSHITVLRNTNGPLGPTRASKTTITSIQPTSVDVGQEVNVQITVQDAGGAGGSTPQGTVTITSTEDPTENYPGSGGATCPSLTPLPAPPNPANSAACVVKIVPTKIGTGVAAPQHQLNATYTSTDGTHTGSSSGSPGTDFFTVSQAPTTTQILSVSTPSPNFVSNSITVNISVTNAASSAMVAPPQIAGITVSDLVGDTCTVNNLTPGGGAVSTGSCSLTFTKVGSLSLRATYPGNTDFAKSNSLDMPYTVNLRTTTTTITHVAPTSVVVGQDSVVQITVQDVAGGNQSTPAGTVKLTSSNDPNEVYPTTNTCTLSGSGNTATCNVTVEPASIGTSPHQLNASYTPNETVHAGSSTTSPTPLAVSAATTTTMITSLSAPSGFVSAPVTVNFTVTNAVSPASAPPTGTVTVTDGPDNCTGALTPVSPTGSSSTGSCALTPSTQGAKSLFATYNGSTDFSTSVSSPATAYTANPRTTATTISAIAAVTIPGSTTVTVTVADTVGDGHSSTPAGAVMNFTSSDTAPVGDTFSAASCTLNASGSCSVTITAHEVGASATHNIKATFGGSAVHATSTSAAQTMTVNKGTATQNAPAASMEVATLLPTQASNKITFSATVASPPSSVTATGTVTFTAGATTLGSAPLQLSSGGGCSPTALTCSATITVDPLSPAGLAAGAYNITATYGGDNNFVANAANTAGTGVALTEVAVQTVHGGQSVTGLPVSWNAAAVGLNSASVNCAVLSLTVPVSTTYPTCSVAGPSTTGFTLTINTSAVASSARRQPATSFSSMYAALFGLPAIVFVGMAVPGGPDDKKRRRCRILSLLCLTITVSMLLFGVGCGAAGFSNPKNFLPPTGVGSQSGDYVVVVWGNNTAMPQSCGGSGGLQTTCSTAAPGAAVALAEVPLNITF